MRPSVTLRGTQGDTPAASHQALLRYAAAPTPGAGLGPDSASQRGFEPAWDEPDEFVGIADLPAERLVRWAYLPTCCLPRLPRATPAACPQHAQALRSPPKPAGAGACGPRPCAALPRLSIAGVGGSALRALSAQPIAHCGTCAKAWVCGRGCRPWLHSLAWTAQRCGSCTSATALNRLLRRRPHSARPPPQRA